MFLSNIWRRTLNLQYYLEISHISVSNRLATSIITIQIFYNSFRALTKINSLTAAITCSLLAVLYSYGNYLYWIICTSHSMRNLHSNIFLRKKYVLSRSMFKNNRHVFFFSIWYLKFSRNESSKFWNRKNWCFF